MVCKGRSEKCTRKWFRVTEPVTLDLLLILKKISRSFKYVSLVSVDI